MTAGAQIANGAADIFFGPPPCVPSILVNNKATFLKRCIVDRPWLVEQSNITSNPAEVVTYQTFLDTTPPEAPKIGSVKSLIDCARKDSPKDRPASEDEDIERWIDDNLPSAKRPRERVTSIVSISSTSSCDMHTNTDVSEDEMENEVRPIQPPPAPTQKIIELILRKVEINLRNAAYKQCTGRSAAHSQARSTLPSGQSSRKTSVSSGSKRKSRLEGSPPPEDDDEDGSSKRRRGSTTTTDESETGARFACPFYKHDPDRHRNRRTCPGPGWPTVHRMKEHLYRSHSQPIFCPICYATFKSDKEQSSHVRLQQCERSLPQQIEGIDRETVWTLRKRTTALRLEEDKWRDVYQVLFPDVSAAEIPSPFYDCDSPSETSRRFRRDLLRRVQEELLMESGQVPTPIEQQLLQRVAQIVRRCEHDLLNQAQPPSSPPSNPDRRASASSINSSYQATPLPAATPAFQRPSLAVPTNVTGRERRYDSLVEADAAPYIPEPTMEFGDVVWNDPPYVFGTGINWEAVFPPAPETQYLGSDEVATNFSVPMWT
ncbi:uncharacterized protein J4E78_009372 [Alternaria triticimaculans]|uniref:uncharacterized protein n=1 Tax=Alternaria triticimaculans TaxID=297637 RepID=UPI0020C4A365|nr:uncharacterized protein J4E78_009372 [Alternaria triticimaculans]KAI4645462.1 hypothetical protein J4E78_009372 [Alternaria triticimaculans]